MKKFAILVVLTIAFSSCSLSSIFDPFKNFDYWFAHEEEFSDLVDVLDLVSTIEYESDDDAFDQYEYLESPKQIYDSWTGDCDEYGMMAGYFAYQDLGIEDVYLVRILTTTIEGGYRIGHMGIKINGVYYEPQYGGWQIGNPDWDAYAFWVDWLGSFYSFDEYPIKEAMYFAVNNHIYSQAYTSYRVPPPAENNHVR
jgi:hypothetical protein